MEPASARTARRSPVSPVEKAAQRRGRARWYRTCRVRVATVERDYGFPG